MTDVTTSRLDAYLTEISRGQFFADATIPYSFAYMVAYYGKHSRMKRRWFRTVSVALIVLSSALPVLAAFGAQFLWQGSKDVVVAISSAFIALFSALLGYFRWEVGWRGQNEALFALAGLEAEWQAAIASAHAAEDEATAIAKLALAYERFRMGTFDVVRAEMGDFFKVQKTPADKTVS